MPVSLMANLALPDWRVSDTFTIPPSGVYLTAFDRRLATTRSNSSSLPLTMMTESSAASSWRAIRFSVAVIMVRS